MHVGKSVFVVLRPGFWDGFPIQIFQVIPSNNSLFAPSKNLSIIRRFYFSSANDIHLVKADSVHPNQCSLLFLFLFAL